MLLFFDNLYASIKDKNKVLKKLRFYSLQRFIVRNVANIILFIYLKFYITTNKFSLLPIQEKNCKLIVSLTSFPKRINKVWLVIETLLRQTSKPDVIILWLSKKQFSSLDVLPQKLLNMRSRGLRIILKEDDLRSHKKYYYTLQEFPNDIMITVDDDIFYPPNMIEELIKWHQKFPNTVIARYGSKIKVLDKNIAIYQEWELNFEQTIPDFKVFFGSGGGTLFPPGSLPVETLNKEVFMNLCLYADDIWLNTMCRLNNVKIFRTRTSLCSLLPILIKKDIYLYSKNINESLNDIQLKNIRKYYMSNRNIDPYLVF
jgi:hypothetical protein